MKSNPATQEPGWVRALLLATGLGFLFFFLGLPLVAVFVEALAQGWPAYVEALKDSETRSAIWLTVVIALAVLPFNILFGVAAAWAIAKFDFRGKSLLIISGEPRRNDSELAVQGGHHHRWAHRHILRQSIYLHRRAGRV